MILNQEYVLVHQWEHNQFIFKLSDLNFNKSSASMSVMSTSCNLSDMVYTLIYLAPELTASDYIVNAKQNSATDIYAFSIIIYQVIFPEIDINTFISPFKYMEALKNDWQPEIPKRFWEKNLNLLCILNVMIKSWYKHPVDRPSAYDILSVVKHTQCAYITANQQVHTVSCNIYLFNTYTKTCLAAKDKT